MQAAAAKWAAAHRGKMCEYSKKWRAKNPDKVRELDKRTPERRARHAILTRERFWANPEKYREMRRSAYAKNPQLRESVYRTNRKRRAQKRGAATGAPIDYGAIAKRAGMKCHLCGKRIRRRDLSFDHLIPLALGGPHVEWNISTAHLSCNASKGARFATPAQLPLL